MIVDGFLNDRGSFLQHLCERADIVEIRQRTVAGNNFHVRWQLYGSFSMASIMPCTLPPLATSMKGKP